MSRYLQELLKPWPSAKLLWGLSEAARQELYALMRTGQGHLSAKKWRDGLLDAEVLGDAAVTAAINEDADLHDHLAKALYELGLSE